MRKVQLVTIILITVIFGILFLGLYLNYLLDDKYLYDSNLPNVQVEQVANLFKERMASCVGFAFAMLLWILVLTALCVRCLVKNK